jgi:hypothetical protein
MIGKICKAVFRTTSVLAVFCLAHAGVAQDKSGSYPSMASLDEYLMQDRNAEIALAESAAPDSVSHNSTVMILGPHGYETAVKGTNGFVCVVERGWMSPFDSPEFWNPKMRGPSCFNPQAARSVLPITIERTKLVLAGRTKDQIMADIRRDFDSKKLPALEPGAMTYMMSPKSNLGDTVGRWVPHLMFYVPVSRANSWGADLAGSPVMRNPQFNAAPEPITVFMVPVKTWSDGTPAPPNEN